MEVSYDADVDILSIILVHTRANDSQEVLPGVVADFDSGRRIIALEIFDASKLADFSEVHVALNRATNSKISVKPGSAPAAKPIS